MLALGVVGYPGGDNCSGVVRGRHCPSVYAEAGSGLVLAVGSLDSVCRIVERSRRIPVPAGLWSPCHELGLRHARGDPTSCPMFPICPAITTCLRTRSRQELTIALVELELEQPPASPEAMEAYFQEHVATAEALAAQGKCRRLLTSHPVSNAQAPRTTSRPPLTSTALSVSTLSPSSCS